VKHEDPSLLEYYTLFTGAVTNVLVECTASVFRVRSPRTAAYGKRDRQSASIFHPCPCLYTLQMMVLKHLLFMWFYS
jgi:hypothetical protein